MRTTYRFNETSIEDLYVVEPFYASDMRGSVRKTFDRSIFEENHIQFDPIEEMETTSRSGAIRGLHFQTSHPQAKLVRCVSGLLLDVVVDLRQQSKTFGRTYSIILSSENKKMLYVPRGFAHGCRALMDTTFCYLSDNVYCPKCESGIIWNDKTLAIDWMLDQVEDLFISERDRNLQTLAEFQVLHGGFI